MEKSVAAELILSKSDRVTFNIPNKGSSVLREKFQIVKVDEKLSGCVHRNIKLPNTDNVSLPIVVRDSQGIIARVTVKRRERKKVLNLVEEGEGKKKI